jgi:dTDP-glucose 4,6-dehydratase
MPADWSIEEDFQDVFENVGAHRGPLSGAHIFITGGTSFIGRWLLETLKLADERLKHGVRATILTRNPKNFLKKCPHLFKAHAFMYLSGDVQSFKFPEGEFTHLIYAVTDASAELNSNDPRYIFHTILEGTRNALDFAVEKKSCAF